VVGLIGLSAVPVCARLRGDAGAALSGHHVLPK
jgi:hypothetical protein